jgi:hypothetical protein
VRRALALVGLVACRFGFDERTIGDGGGGDVHPAGDASDAPTDAMGATACGTVSLIADDFSAATAGDQWYPYANGGGTTAQTGGELVVALPATTSSSPNYSGYDSAFHYDLRGNRVYVEVTQVVSTTTHAQTDIQVAAVNGDSLTITEEFGILTASTLVGGTTVNLNAIAYNAVQQRWWSFREAGGMIYFETSPDGTTWTPFSMTPTPSYAPLVAVVLETGSYQQETNAGSSHFDNLDGGTPSGMWCKGSSLRDDFSSGVIDSRWGATYATGGCTNVEAGGAVNMMLKSNATQDCGLASAAGFDLTGDAVFTALTTVPANNGNIYTILRASSLAGDNVEVGLVGTSIISAQNVGGVYTELTTNAYDPVAHKFWQLAVSGGMLHFQVSPDGMSWSDLHAQVSPISLVGVFLSIGTGTTGNVSNPGSAVFITFDQLPP